jgi:hypothetical protein
VDKFQTMTVGGIRGNHYHSDDAGEAQRLAERDGYEVLDVFMEDEGRWTIVVAD